MPSNPERRAHILELQQQLQVDVATLQKNFRSAVQTLEKECRQAVAELEAEIRQQAAAEVTAARAQVGQILREAGIDAATLLAGWNARLDTPGARRTYRASTVLHHGPNGKVWNGRGRMPEWFKAARQGTRADVL